MTYIATPQLVQAGRITGLSTGTNGTQVGSHTLTNDTIITTRHPVVFPVAFSSVPTVVATQQGNNAGTGTVIDIRVENATVTTTGCNILVTDSAQSGISVNWIATTF